MPATLPGVTLSMAALVAVSSACATPPASRAQPRPGAPSAAAPARPPTPAGAADAGAGTGAIDDPVAAPALTAALRAHEVLTTPDTLSPADSRVLAAAACDELADAVGAPRAGGSWPGVPSEDRVLLRARAADLLAHARRPVPSDLALRLVRAMTAATSDPNTFVVDPDGLVALLAQVGGEPLVGPGFRAHITAEARWVVSEVEPDSPAAHAGLRPGDRVLSIDGHAVDRAHLAALTGAADGTRVALKLERGPGAAPRSLSLTLTAFQPRITQHRALGGGVGYLRISALTESSDPARDAGHQIDAALVDLGRHKVHRLVVDLRDDAGGAPRQVASRFVPRGPLVYRRRADSRVDPMPRAGPPPRRWRRIAVLVDRSTEGAAEVVALSMQSHGVARVFGQPTAGALSVPQPIHLPGSLSLFVPRALILDPAGKKPPPGRRVTPDQLVASTTAADVAAGRDPPLDAARAWLKQH